MHCLLHLSYYLNRVLKSNSINPFLRVILEAWEHGCCLDSISYQPERRNTHSPCPGSCQGVQTFSGTEQLLLVRLFPYSQDPPWPSQRDHMSTLKHIFQDWYNSIKCKTHTNNTIFLPVCRSSHTQGSHLITVAETVIYNTFILS